jgi:hypothetical protein
MAEDGLCVNYSRSGAKRENSGQVAPRRRTYYFLLQPSLPPREVMVVRDGSVLIAPTRPLGTRAELFSIGTASHFPGEDSAKRPCQSLNEST